MARLVLFEIQRELEINTSPPAFPVCRSPLKELQSDANFTKSKHAIR